jgi:hypothetical protein
VRLCIDVKAKDVFHVSVRTNSTGAGLTIQAF